MPITPIDLYLVLYAVGVLTVGYGAWRMVRRVVHLFDSIEVAAARTTQAVDLIIHEFATNGGRNTLHLETDEQAQRATLKDLLLDLRSLLHQGNRVLSRHDDLVASRVQAIINAVKEK